MCTYTHLSKELKLPKFSEKMKPTRVGMWLEKIKLTNQQAHRFMKVSQEYEKSNLTMSLNLGLNVLYQIAILPEEERTKEHKKSLPLL